MDLKGIYRKYFPSPLKKLVHSLRQSNKLNLGDLERSNPISTQFGYDRGGPIDRIYIEDFLQRNAAAIHGRVLEIGDNEYTKKFGGHKVVKSDVLHIHERNPMATIIGDLTTVDIEDNSFDCIILTQTLQLIYDFRAAAANCRRILKPGGTLLLTVPGIVNLPHDEWEVSYYCFSTHLLEKLAKDVFPGDKHQIKSYGNVFTAAMFLYGLGAPEIKKDFFSIHDKHYQVLISMMIQKGT